MRKRLLCLTLTLVTAMVMFVTGITTLVSPTAKAASASTVGTELELTNAFSGGGDYALRNDIVLNNTVEVPSGKTVSLDLNGYSLTVADSAGNHIYAINNKGVLTLKNSESTGSIVSRGIYNGYDGSSVDGTVAGAKLIVESGAYVAQDANGGAAIFNCAELIINGGTFQGKVAAVNNRSQGVATINGGTFRTGNHLGGSVVSYAIQNNGGNLTINNATVDKGFGAIGQWGGTTVVYNGIFMPTGTVDTSCHVVYVSDGDMTIEDGTFVMNYPVDAVPANGNAVYAIESDSLKINGGKFTGVSTAVSGNNNTVVTAGNFSTAFGTDNFNTLMSYVPAENVDDVETIVYVAKSDDVYYESLQEAFAAGGNITVLKNTTWSNAYNSGNPATLKVESGKHLVLDLNGKTIGQYIDDNGLSVAAIAVRAGGGLTIKDSVGGGKLVACSVAVQLEGTLTLESGTISVSNPTATDKDPSMGWAYGVWMYKRSATAEAPVFNMTGGAIVISDELVNIHSANGCANVVAMGDGVDGIDEMYNDAIVNITAGTLTEGAPLCVAEKANVIVPAGTVVNGEVTVTTYDELIDVLADGKIARLQNDIIATGAVSATDADINLNGKTLTLTVGSNYFLGDSTIRNGSICITGCVAAGDCIIGIGNYSNSATLNLNNVNLYGDGYSSAYAVLYVYNSSTLNINGGSIIVANDNASAGGVIKAHKAAEGKINIVGTAGDPVELSFTNAKIGMLDGTTLLNYVDLDIQGGANAINQTALTIKNSTININGADGRALTLKQGDVVIENSILNLSNCSEGEIRFKESLTLSTDANTSISNCTIYADSAATGAKVNDTLITAAETEKAEIEVVNGQEVLTCSFFVNGVGYTNFDKAMAYAKTLTGDVTVTLSEKVTLKSALTGNYDSINFVGTSADAEIYLEVQGYITATGKKVSFESLQLSKSYGTFINNAGFMNVAFGIYDVVEVNYTDCTFINGSYASSGVVTYNNCTFYKSHEKYGLWAYGDVNVTVNGGKFSSQTIGDDKIRGIKMYAEGAAKTTDLTVKNVDFSEVNNKPAIVLTYGESVTLEGNTYSATGVFELDKDGNPEGTTVKADISEISCMNDNYADCGVLVDGKIYTTIEKALELDAITSTSKVVLMYDTDNQITIPCGAVLDLNGHSAPNVVNGLFGTGTVADPYVINNVTDLKWFRDQVNAGNNYDDKYIALTADIDLNNEEWMPIGTSANTFNGMFDGQNNTISNLKISWSTDYVKGGANQNYAGLFGYMKGGSNSGIKNLTVENADVSGCLYVGVILGRSYTGGIIENCHVTGDINVIAYEYVGGIVGRHDYSQGPNANSVNMAIYNSSVKDTTTDGGRIESVYDVSYVGGIVGFVGEGKYVIDSCSVENVTIVGIYSVGGVSGIAHYGNQIKGSTIDNITIIADQQGYDDTNRENNVGLIAGACQGTNANPSVISGNTVTNVTATKIDSVGNSSAITNLYGNNMNGSDAVTNFAAQIGDTYFDTLADAIAQAGNGDTIVVIRDVVVNDILTVAEDKVITLDLNGKKVSMVTAEDSKYALILNYGNLTIDDSSATKLGTLSYKYTGTNNSDAFNTVETAPGSILTVKAGKIENLSSNCLIAYAIDGLTNGNMGDVVVNVEGGVISSEKQAIRIFANSTTNTGTLNISGGEMHGRVIIQSSNANANKAVLNVTGGEFNANDYKVMVLYVGGSQGATSAVEASVSNGTFKGEVYSTIDKPFISGGTYTVKMDDSYLADGFGIGELADGTFGVREYAIHVAYSDGTFGYFDDINDAVPHTTNYDKLEGATITLYKDIVDGGIRFVENDMTLDLNGHTYTVNTGTGSNGTETSAFQVRDTANNVLIKNGNIVIDPKAGSNIVWVFNTYTNLVLENVVVDMAKASYSGYGDQVYGVVVQYASDSVTLTGDSKFINFDQANGGAIAYVEGTLEFNDLDAIGGDIEAKPDAIIKAPYGLDIKVADTDFVKYENGEYKVYTRVATVNDVDYASLQDALNDAVTAGDTVVVEIAKDINLSGTTWTPVYFNSYPATGANTLIIDGNNFTITGLNDMLFSRIWTGTKFEVKDLTISNANIMHDVNDTAGTTGVGAIVGYVDAIKDVVINNVTLIDSHVEGGHWTGGFFGYVAGYSAQNDGPVFTNVSITNSAVINSTIVGKGSVGGVVGHATGSTWTSFGIEDSTITGNEITSTGSSSNKAGIVMGTIGAAGTEEHGQIGGVSVDVVESGNTAVSNTTTITTVYGRQGTATGKLEIAGGSYENNPIEDGVAYAGPADGVKIAPDANGGYTVIPRLHKTYEVGAGKAFATLEDAIAQGKVDDVDHVTFVIYGEVDFEPVTTDGNNSFHHGIVDFGSNLTVTIEGGDASAKLTIVGGGVPDIKGVTFKNITLADEGTYNSHVNEFMYQNYIDTTFINVTFVDGIRLSGDSVLTDCTVNVNTYNEYAIWLDDGKFEITGSDIIGGEEGYGLIKSDTAEELVLENNVFEYLGVANKEALNVKDVKITATNNTFIDCIEGIIPADKTNYDATGVEIKNDQVAAMNTVITNYAKIGEVKYQSLQDAIDVAANGTTIDIINNIKLTNNTIEIPAGKEITINLNGYSITGTPTEAKAYSVIINRGNTTINGAGTIACDHTLAGSTGYAVNTITNAGTLVLDNNVVVTNTSTASNQIGYAIDNNSTSADAILVVENAQISASGSNYYDGIRQFANSTVNENIVTVNGGSVSSIWLQNPSDGASDKNTKDVKASIEVNGGNVNAIYLEPSTDFDAAITGGTIGSVSYFQQSDGRDLVGFVTGGTFGTAIDEAFVSDSADFIVVAGKTYVGSDVANVYDAAQAKIGNKYYTLISDAVQALNEGDTLYILAGNYTENLSINVKNVTVIGELDSNNDSLVNFTGKLSVTANGVTVKNLNFTNASERAGYINAEDVVIDNCTMIGYYGFRYCYTDGIVTFKNSTIKGDVYGIHFDGNEGGEIVIDNCVISGWTSFAAKVDKVTMTGTEFEEGYYNYIRFYQEEVAIDGCTFNKDMAIDLAVDGAKLTIDNSTVEGGKSVEDLFEDADIAYSDIIVDGTQIRVAAEISNANGVTYYDVLADAVSALAEGDVLTIFEGEHAGGLSINKANVTVIGELDSNNNKLATINGRLSVTGNGVTVKNLNVVNNSGNGGYISAKDVVIENCNVTGSSSGFRSCYTKGLVTFKDSTITGQVYGIHFDGSAGGEIVIDNCVITGWTSFAKAIKKVTLTDTKFEEGNYNYVRFYQEEVAIDGCTFNEDMVVDISNDVVTNLTIDNSTVEGGKSVEDLFADRDIAYSNIVVDNVKLVKEARIDNANGTLFYDTIAQAFAASTAGDTIVLLEDAIDLGALTIKEGVTLDGNGKQVTGNTALYMKAGSKVTNVNFKDVANANGKLSAIYAIGLAGKVEIVNNVFDNVQYDAIQITPVAGAEIVITGNVFKGDSYRYVHIQSVLADNVAFKADVTANKMYNDNATTSPLDVYYFADASLINVGGNYIKNTDNVCILNSNGDNVAEEALPLMNEALDAPLTIEASIKGEYSVDFYTTLADAFANAKAGDVINLLSDITVTEQIKVADNAVLADITLNGNDHTITANFAKEGADAKSVLYFGDTSTGAWATGVKINNLKIDGTARFGIALMGGTSSKLKDVTITGDYYYGINLYGTHGATMDNCNVVSMFTNGSDDYRLDLTNNTKVGTLYANKSDITEGAKVFIDSTSSVDTLYFWGDSTVMVDANSIDRITNVISKNAVAVAKFNNVYYTSLAGALEAAKDETDPVIDLVADATYDISAWDSYAIGGANANTVTINGNGNTLTFNKLNSDWNNVVTANDAKLILNNITLADSGHNGGPWNRYDINFGCDVELNNVVSNKPLAFKADATLNTVTVNDTKDVYAIWVQANGQDVVIDGLEVNAGRGIKIDEQYVDAQEVDLDISNSTFNTTKKSAILVKSKEGATITASNVDITNVAADNENLVWVDSDSANYYSEVSVSGTAVSNNVTINATLMVEDIASFGAAIVVNGEIAGYYKTLQNAIDAAKDGDVITLLADNNEDVIIKQVEGVNVIVDGGNYKYSGTIEIYGNARYNGAETLTIKNVNFVTDEAGHVFITCDTTDSVKRYAHNVTVQDSTFTATGAAVNSAVGMKFRQCYDIAIVNTTSDGLHSVLQATNCDGFLADNVTITSGKNGLSVGGTKNAVVKNSNINVTGYGIRADGEVVGDIDRNLTVDSSTINAELPVVVRKATGDYKVTMVGTNNLTAGNADGYQIIMTNGDDGTYIIPTGSVELEGAKNYNTFGGVALVNGEYFSDIQDAIDAATNGSTITIVDDSILTKTLKINEGKKVTIDLNGYVIDGVNNVNIAIMSYGDLTIKDSSTAQTGAIKAGKTASKSGNAVNICKGTFTLESGTIYSVNNAILVDEEAANITISGGKVIADDTTKNAAALYVSSKQDNVITITGGEIVGYNGILIWNNTELDISGGSISGNGSVGIQGNGAHDNTLINIYGNANVYGYYTAIYHPQGGTLNIGGDAVLTGYTGAVVKGGNVTISDNATIKGTGAAKDYKPVSSGFEDTGDGLYIENFGNPAYGKPNVVINGGKFESTEGYAVSSYVNTNNTTDKVENFIYNGTFEGAKALDLDIINENANFIIEGNTTYVGADADDKVENAEARIGKHYYTTLLEALAAAKDGETVNVVNDVELYTRLIFSLYTNGKNVTVDGKDTNSDKIYKLYASSTNWGTGNGKHLINVNCDNVTLKNLVLDCNNIAQGVNIYKAQNIVFDNISIINKGVNTGITVNGSTLTLKNALVVKGGGWSIDIDKSSNGTLGLVAEEGTVLDLGGTILFADKKAYENSDLSGAKNVDGTSYYTYQKLDTNGKLSGYTNSFSRISNGCTYKLLEDATVSTNVTACNKGHVATIDLNGHNFTVADGNTVSILGTLKVEGEGAIAGALQPVVNDVEVNTSAKLVMVYDANTNKGPSYGALIVPTGAETVTAGNTITVGNVIATVDGVAYYDFEEAIVAAISNDKELIVETNVEGGFSLGIPANYNFTLNLNGCKVIFNTQIVNEGKLVINDNKGTGVLTNNGLAEVVIENNGELVINAGTVAEKVKSTKTAIIEASANVANHNFVANIGNTYYLTLEEAFANAKKGDVIELIKDVTLAEQIKVTDKDVLSDITLNGNDHTINVAFAKEGTDAKSALYFGDVNTNAWATGVEINDVTISGTARFGIALMGGTSSVLNNVDVIGDYYYGINLYGTHGATLNGCEIDSMFTNGSDDYKLDLINGTLVKVLYANESQIAEANAKIFVDDASKVQKLYYWGASSKVVDESAIARNRIGELIALDGPVVATLNNHQYTKLETALADASITDGVLTLLADANLVDAFKVNSTLTINLNGYTMTLPATANYAIVVNGDLTINGAGNVVVNGIYGIGLSTSCVGGLTINGGNYTQTAGDYLIGAFGGKVTINDGTFYADYCVVNSFAGYGATVEVKGGKFAVNLNNADDSFAIFHGDDVNVSGGIFNEYIPEDHWAYGYIVIEDGHGATSDYPYGVITVAEYANMGYDILIEAVEAHKATELYNQAGLNGFDEMLSLARAELDVAEYKGDVDRLVKIYLSEFTYVLNAREQETAVKNAILEVRQYASISGVAYKPEFVAGVEEAYTELGFLTIISDAMDKIDQLATDFEALKLAKIEALKGPNGEDAIHVTTAMVASIYASTNLAELNKAYEVAVVEIAEIKAFKQALVDLKTVADANAAALEAIKGSLNNINGAIGADYTDLLNKINQAIADIADVKTVVDETNGKTATSDELSNVYDKLSNELETTEDDIIKAIGVEVAKAITEINKTNDTLNNVLVPAITIIGKETDAIVAAIKEIREIDLVELEKALTGEIDDVQKVVNTISDRVATNGGLYTEIITKVDELVGNVIDAEQTHYEEIKQLVENAIAGIKDLDADALKYYEELDKLVDDAILDIADVQKTVDSIKDTAASKDDLANAYAELIKQINQSEGNLKEALGKESTEIMKWLQLNNKALSDLAVVLDGVAADTDNIIDLINNLNDVSTDEIEQIVEDMIKGDLTDVLDFVTEINDRVATNGGLYTEIFNATEGLINDLTAKCDTAFSQILGKLGTIETATGADLSTLTDLINDAIADIADVQKVVDDINTNMATSADIAKKYGDLIGILDTMEDDIIKAIGTEVSKAITEINKTNDTLNNVLVPAITVIGKETDAIVAAIKELREIDLVELEKALTGEIDDVQKVVNTISDRVATNGGLYTEIFNATKGLIDGLTAKCDTAFSQILGKLGTIETATGADFSSLTDLINDAIADIADVKKVVDGINTNMATSADIATKYADLIGKLGTMEGNIVKAIKDEVKLAINEINKANATLNELKPIINTISNKVDGVSDQADAILDAIDNLGAIELGNIHNDIDSIIDAVNGITERIKENGSLVNEILNGVDGLLTDIAKNAETAATQAKLAAKKADLAAKNAETAANNSAAAQLAAEQAKAAADAANDAANEATDAAIEAKNAAISAENAIKGLENATMNTETAAKAAEAAAKAAEAAAKAAEAAAKAAAEKTQTAEVKEYAAFTTAELETWIKAYVEELVKEFEANDNGLNNLLTAYADNASFRSELETALGKVYTENNKRLILAYYDQAISQIATATTKAEIDYVLESFKANVALVDTIEAATPKYDTTLVILTVIVTETLMALAIVIIVFASRFKKKKKAAKEDK